MVLLVLLLLFFHDGGVVGIGVVVACGLGCFWS